MTRNHQSHRPLLLALLLTAPWAWASSAEEVLGYWSGKLTYQGAELAINLDIREQDDVLIAELDIPAFIYANQPLPVVVSDDSVVLEFPFGIGELPAELAGPDRIAVEREGFALALERADKPGFSTVDIQFGAFEPELDGTLYLPPGKGPYPVVVLIAGSGRAQRSDSFYGSWVEFYLNLGIGAFIYDRRPEFSRLPDGSIPGIEDHAADVAYAIQDLRSVPAVSDDDIGLAGHSRGSWIAMATANQVDDIAFIILSSPAASTPAEQEIASVLTGMRQDGMTASDIADARAYLGLYFYVAHTGRGWETLATEIGASGDTNWLQYVDQPRSLDDLDWWHVNMDFDAVSELENIADVPLLAMWGGDDFITPWVEFRLPLEESLAAAGNRAVTTKVFAGADHRLRINAGQDDGGNFYWFGMAPGVLDAIAEFVRGTVTE